MSDSSWPQWPGFSPGVAPPPLRSGGRARVHVLQLTLPDAHGTDIGPLLARLSPSERARVRRLRVARKRVEFALTRSALRAVLARYLPLTATRIDFVIGGHGKPSLPPPHDGITFNVSHSHRIALVAVSSRVALGVDVEWMRDRVRFTRIAARFFSAAEQRDLSSLPPHLQRQAFYRCWSLKEAVIKGHGRGIGLGLDRFDVTLEPAVPPALLATRWDPAEAAQWRLEALPIVPGYAAALAVRCTEFTLRRWTLGTGELLAQAAGE